MQSERLKQVGPAVIDRVRAASITAALREQELDKVAMRLEELVPSVAEQYTDYAIDTRYLTASVRGLHAFQVQLARRAVELVSQPGDALTLVDIGDSAGTHLRYLRALIPDRELRTIGVNLDAEAVEKIRRNGVEAIESRAEDLLEHGIEADIFMSFETVEHLMSPIQVMRDLAEGSRCRAFVVTVPYVEHSRVGLYHIRREAHERVSPETTHIFELAPEDWKLLFRHSGWEIVEDETYLQYPRRGPLRLTKPLWSQTAKYGAHEGFWGAVLRRDASWSQLYTGW